MGMGLGRPVAASGCTRGRPADGGCIDAESLFRRPPGPARLSATRPASLKPWGGFQALGGRLRSNAGRVLGDVPNEPETKRYL